MAKMIYGVVLLLAFTSCRTKQDLSYFDDIRYSTSGSIWLSDYSIKIEPEDELMITVSSEVPAATAQYNLPLSNPTAQSSLPSTTLSLNQGESQSPSSLRQPTYVVDKEGNIDFPVLGAIHVAGLTTSELKEYLKGAISRDVIDPHVRVALINFKVNVLGEVTNPQILTVPGERFTIMEALAACGDLTPYGQRDNVIVMREQSDGTVAYQRLNLHDSSIISSPYYYLKQNDVVYVEPNEIKQNNSKYDQQNGYKLSVISTIVSACSVIASLIIALAVK